MNRKKHSGSTLLSNAASMASQLLGSSSLVSTGLYCTPGDMVTMWALHQAQDALDDRLNTTDVVLSYCGFNFMPSDNQDFDLALKRNEFSAAKYESNH